MARLWATPEALPLRRERVREGKHSLRSRVVPDTHVHDDEPKQKPRAARPEDGYVAPAVDAC
jgi:hypothetical protein